jgi:hypothetical protein
MNFDDFDEPRMTIFVSTWHGWMTILGREDDGRETSELVVTGTLPSCLIEVPHQSNNV